MKRSAGILAYRLKEEIQFFLVHPGGPFFKNKDKGSWTIPKGEPKEGEELIVAARREFFEETGYQLAGDFIELLPVRQKGGKLVLAWAIEIDLNENDITSNTFEMQWPPKSGLLKTFPEIDMARWFSISEALEKINPAQVSFIDEVNKLSTT